MWIKNIHPNTCFYETNPNTWERLHKYELYFVIRYIQDKIICLGEGTGVTKFQKYSVLQFLYKHLQVIILNVY